MPINDQGFWVPNLFPKQFEVFNARERYLLVSGPRKSGKTIAVLHKIARHLWETPGAKAAMISKQLKTAKEGGSWDDLIHHILPEWFDGAFGMRFTTADSGKKPGPKYEPDTKTLYFRVTNYHGGESEMRLYSLDNENELESKLKQRRFSCIYFPELDNFESREVFTVSIMQLRCLHLAREQHLWLADTNPSEEGENSWIYKIWYQERLKAGHKQPDFQKQLRLLEIFCHENPWFSKYDQQEIMAACEYDEELYKRWVEGKWTVGGMRRRHFAGVWKPNLHIAGSAPEKTRPENWEIAIPSEHCSQLFTGWDPGDTNHAAIIGEKIEFPGGSQFVILDELVFTKTQITIEDFTFEFLAKMEALEKLIPHPVAWRHWSDDSAINRWRASVGIIDALLIERASGGKIKLVGCPKEADSVRKRIILTKRLLARQQLYISAHCTRLITMFNELRKPNTTETIAVGDENKHAFDALTYALSMETYDELAFERHQPNLQNRILST